MAKVTRRGAALAGAALMTGAADAPSAFDFRLTAIEGAPLNLAAFRSKVLLVVNTASFCGFTPQYAALQRLHQRYEARGLMVLGVPSTDFNQESSDPHAIKEFCDANYDVTFPMTTPEHVKPPHPHPLFAWLAARAGGPPRWNFHKYLVARDGRTVTAFDTRTEPEAPVVIRTIEAALRASPAV
jgi:glutathione peroxidase